MPYALFDDDQKLSKEFSTEEEVWTHADDAGRWEDSPGRRLHHSRASLTMRPRSLSRHRRCPELLPPAFALTHRHTIQNSYSSARVNTLPDKSLLTASMGQDGSTLETSRRRAFYFASCVSACLMLASHGAGRMTRTGRSSAELRIAD